MSEMEPRYESSKITMLQLSFATCLMRNSFILPVKFPWVPLCLPRTARTARAPWFTPRSPLIWNTIQKLPASLPRSLTGFQATGIAEGCQPSSKAGSASGFHPMITECEVYGRTLHAPSRT